MSLWNPSIQAGTADGFDGGADAPACSCVGIVIGVPEPMASDLQRARASFGDPLAALIPAHITVVTTTETEDWDIAARHVRQVARRHKAFEISLRGTATFRPVSPVVYLQVESGHEECVALHKDMQTGPLSRDLPFPYHPHVTVAHDVSEAGMDYALESLQDYEARFMVRTIGLYEHDATGFWRLREEVALEA